MTKTEKAFKRWFAEYSKGKLDRGSDEDDLREAFLAGAADRGRKVASNPLQDS